MLRLPGRDAQHPVRQLRCCNNFPALLGPARFSRPGLRARSSGLHTQPGRGPCGGDACLKPSATLWLNLGDAYNTHINWQAGDYRYSSLGKDGKGLPATNSAYTKKRGRRRACIRRDTPWLQYGNLLAIPYRVVSGLCDLDFLFRGEVIWEKSRPLPEGRCRRPHRKHEGIYIFAKSERHLFQVKPPLGSVWKLLQRPNRTSHCSTFPIDLPLRRIKATGMTSGIAFDPFMGSGTTGRAARMLGHQFLGFEVNQHYCQQQ